MPRAHFTKVVAIRPTDHEALPRHYAWPDGLERAASLPLPLLELASYLKFCSPVRVDLLDLRAPDQGQGLDLRRQLSISAPDVVLVQLESGNLSAGLAAARAARDCGAELVLATGNLVRMAPNVVHAGTEWDGGLAGSPAQLVSALTRFQNGAQAADVLAHLSLPATEQGGWHPDRKLVDYGRYLQSGVPSSQLLTSHHWSPQESRPLDEVVAEVLECESLGITDLELRGPLDEAATHELFARLARLQVKVSLTLPLPLLGPEKAFRPAPQLGAVDAGSVGSQDWGVLLERLPLIRERFPGLVVRAELRLDDLEPQRLHQLEGLARHGLKARLALGLSSFEDDAWSSFLRSPSRSFRPPLLAPDETRAHRLLREGRGLFAARGHRGSRRGRMLRSLRRLVSS